MNHYERLKVSRDAPLEVIRAAYRALAQTLPDDASRESHLLALNEAYETLSDPDARQAYDSVLWAGVADIELEPLLPEQRKPDESAEDLDIALDALTKSVADASAASSESDEEQADPWQAVYDASPSDQTRSWTQQPVVWVGGGLLLLMAAAVGVWGWQQYTTSHVTQDIAVQVGRVAPEVGLPVEPQSQQPQSRAAESAPAPSVEELARMSDEELLQVLPALDGKKPVAEASRRTLPPTLDPAAQLRSGVASRHPLDGAPLKLRTEAELVDPLAPALAPSPR